MKTALLLHADNCLAKAATSRGKSQTTLRFASSAPAAPNTSQAPASAPFRPVSCDDDNPARHASAPAKDMVTHAAAAPACKSASDPAIPSGNLSPRSSRRHIPVSRETASPVKKKNRRWSSSASEGSTEWVVNRGSTASCSNASSTAAAARSPAAVSPAGPAEEQDTVTFNTFAVGRRFHPVTKVAAGQAARLRAEPGNARDPNALQVVSEGESPEGSQCLGYLPATVAAALAAHLALGSITVLLTVLEPPKTPKASVPLKVKVDPQRVPSTQCTHLYSYSKA